MDAQYNDSGGIVARGSVLAATAQEIFDAHGGTDERGQSFGLCRRCGAPMPCAPTRTATAVLIAAGLPVPRSGAGGAPAVWRPVRTQPAEDSRATPSAPAERVPAGAGWARRPGANPGYAVPAPRYGADLPVASAG